MTGLLTLFILQKGCRRIIGSRSPQTIQEKLTKRAQGERDVQEQSYNWLRKRRLDESVTGFTATSAEGDAPDSRFLRVIIPSAENR